MVRSDVVEYLRENLPKFPVEDLRRQLYGEGVSDIDFEQCLTEALRNPKTLSSAKRPAPSGKPAKFLFAGGLAVVVVVLLFALARPPSPPPVASSRPPAADGESGYVSPRGWVIRLPKDYEAVAEYKDGARTREVVHFCKRGTDPTSFLDTGLFGQMGIVRLDVSPSPFPSNPTGAAALAAAVSRKTAARGEKFVSKSVQIATLSGIQVNIQSPFPRVEAYVLGRDKLYFFYGGQEDDVWRDIVLSLRDSSSEN